nr:unnamed protein product [Haemonchus contortus]
MTEPHRIPALVLDGHEADMMKVPLGSGEQRNTSRTAAKMVGDDGRRGLAQVRVKTKFSNPEVCTESIVDGLGKGTGRKQDFRFFVNGLVVNGSVDRAV